MATGSAVKTYIAQLKKSYDTLRKGKDALLAIIDEADVPESVYNSNAIENSTLTLKETERILMELEVSRKISFREVFEAKIDPSKQGGVSWLELLRRDVQTAGLESKFMGQVMSQVALLSDFEVSQAVLKVSKKGILPTSTEFVMSFTEPNPTQFPAIGFSLMQEGGRVYASTGPDIKNAFMVLWC